MIAGKILRRGGQGVSRPAQSANSQQRKERQLQLAGKTSVQSERGGVGNHTEDQKITGLIKPGNCPGGKMKKIKIEKQKKIKIGGANLMGGYRDVSNFKPSGPLGGGAKRASVGISKKKKTKKQEERRYSGGGGGSYSGKQKHFVRG